MPQAQWTVPLTSFSGFSSGYFNEYNGHSQYGYAAKHNPMVFFTDTNGGNDATPTNPLSSHYAPLQQLRDRSGQWRPWPITTGLLRTYTTICTARSAEATKGLTGDAANIRQGDDFLKPDRSCHHGVKRLQK